jgi:hypothetical protein
MARFVDCLMKELEKRFLTHGVMDSMGVVYMCKRLSHTHNTGSNQSDAKASFVKHLCVIKKAYCNPKKVSNFDVWVLEVLLGVALDIQQSMFKLSMKLNAIDAMAKSSDVNLVSHLWRILSCLWRILSASRVLSFSFSQIISNWQEIHELVSIVITCY